MKKCNICGKIISEFSSECPYCHNNINSGVDKKVLQKRNEYKKSKAKANVIISLIWAFVLTFIFDVTLRMPGFTIINIIDVILEILCIAYSMFVICNCRIIALLKNKLLLIIATIAGILFLFLQISISYRAYGLGIFAIDTYPFICKFIRVIEYALRSILIATIIIDTYFLWKDKKSKITIDKSKTK